MTKSDILIGILICAMFFVLVWVATGCVSPQYHKLAIEKTRLEDKISCEEALDELRMDYQNQRP